MKALMVSIAVRYRYQRTKQAKLYTRTFATRPFFAFNSSDTSVDTVGINQIKPYVRPSKLSVRPTPPSSLPSPSSPSPSPSSSPSILTQLSQTTPQQSPSDSHAKTSYTQHFPTSYHSSRLHSQNTGVPQQRTQRKYVPHQHMPPRRDIAWRFLCGLSRSR